MNPLYWKAQRLAWKAQRKAMRERWRAEREVARAQWRARHPRTLFGAIWGTLWGLFWIGLFCYWVFGCPEARQNLYQLSMPPWMPSETWCRTSPPSLVPCNSPY
jgi:hypothetical protein